MPKVTVMIPAYNAGKYIRDALESALRQDYEDWEVIVVDDCSTDNTYEIAAEFKKDPRVRLFRNRKRLGDYKTRNRILKLARGKYIAPHDADDIMLQGRLRLHVAILERNTALGGVFGGFLEADEELAKLVDTTRVERCGRSGPVKKMPGSFSHCAATIAKKQMVRAGGYNSKAPIGGDTDLFLRLFRQTRFYFLNKPCFIYRINSKSKTQKIILKGAARYKRIFSHKEKKGSFLVAIGNRKVVINKVAQKALSTFRWRLAFYNKYKIKDSSNNRVCYKMKWTLRQSAALANSDTERFRRGFLEPFSQAIGCHKQILVRAILVSHKGKGTIFFAAEGNALSLMTLSLVLRHRYSYHSGEACIVFLKEGKAYGENFILPVVLTRRCEWAREGYKKKLFWNPLIKKSFFDMALSFPHLIGAQCVIATLVSVVVDRGTDKIRVKSLKPSECYSLVEANTYGAKNANLKQCDILQTLAKQAKSFLIKTPRVEDEALVNRLVRLTAE